MKISINILQYKYTAFVITISDIYQNDLNKLYSFSNKKKSVIYLYKLTMTRNFEAIDSEFQEYNKYMYHLNPSAMFLSMLNCHFPNSHVTGQQQKD